MEVAKTTAHAILRTKEAPARGGPTVGPSTTLISSAPRTHAGATNGFTFAAAPLVMISTPVMPTLSKGVLGPASCDGTHIFMSMSTLGMTASSIVTGPGTIVVMTSIRIALLHPHAIGAIHPCEFVITTMTPSTVHHMLRLAGASNQCPSTVAGIAVVVLLSML